MRSLLVGAVVTIGIGALGVGNALAGLAATPLDDEDVVEAVVDGPLSSEQPLAQPVAAGPTKVGEDGP